MFYEDNSKQDYVGEDGEDSSYTNSSQHGWDGVKHEWVQHKPIYTLYLTRCDSLFSHVRPL